MSKLSHLVIYILSCVKYYTAMNALIVVHWHQNRGGEYLLDLVSVASLHLALHACPPPSSKLACHTPICYHKLKLGY